MELLTRGMITVRNEELFVQVPHWVIEYLMTADLNMTQFRIFSAVIRYTYGFHKSEAWLSLDFLEQLTRCDKRQVRRELKVMTEREIIRKRIEGKKQYLSINPKLKQTKEDYSDPYIEDSLDPHIKKDINKNKYITLPSDEHPFLNFYKAKFKSKMNKEHMKVKSDKLNFILENMQMLEREIDNEEFEAAVNKHFDELPKKNNGNILAFIEAFPRYFEVYYIGQEKKVFNNNRVKQEVKEEQPFEQEPEKNWGVLMDW